MRRARGRPLMRAAATTAVVAGTAAAVGGAVRHHQDQKYAQQDMAAYSQQQGSYPPDQSQYPPAQQNVPPQDYAAAEDYPPAAPAAPSPGAELMVQLQQLSALHQAGVLTDEEFTAAKQKLLGT